MRYKTLGAVSVLIASLYLPLSHAQGETPPITSENAHDVSLISRLGYGAITDIAFSSDGEYFAVGTGTGVVLYTIDNLSEEPRFFEGGTRTVAFNPDSTILAVSGHLWDVETGDLELEFEGYSPVFSSDGSRIIAASEQEVFVLDTATREELMRQTVGGDISEIHINGDDVTLAIDLRGSSSDLMPGLILWNLETGATTVELAGPGYPTIYSGETVFSPDGTMLLHAGFDGYAIWRVATGEVIRAQETWFNPDLNSAAFSTDGSRIAIGDGDAGISVLETMTGQTVDSFRHEDEVHSVAFSSDSAFIAAAAINGIIHIWDADTREEYAALTGFSNIASVIGFDESDTVLSAASIGGAAWQWNLDSGAQISAAQGYKFHVSHGTIPYPNTIELNENSNLLATGSAINGRIRLWTPTGQSRGILEMGVGQDGLDVAFTLDSEIMAALSYGNVYMWELETGSRIRGIRIRDRAATNIEFSPDGSLLAAGDQEGRTTLQDRVNARVIADFQGAEGDVTNLTFSPDGAIIAFSNYCWRCTPDDRDYMIRMWNANTGELLHSLEGHSGFVKGLAFSPDGSVLASIGKDGTLRFWNTVTGEELAVIQEQASALAFSHSGTILATSSTDGAIRLWGLPGEPRE